MLENARHDPLIECVAGHNLRVTASFPENPDTVPTRWPEHFHRERDTELRPSITSDCRVAFGLLTCGSIPRKRRDEREGEGCTSHHLSPRFGESFVATPGFMAA
jgi:hypothetical protein